MIATVVLAMISKTLCTHVTLIFQDQCVAYCQWFWGVEEQADFARYDVPSYR